jgi:hypothetical protein
MRIPLPTPKDLAEQPLLAALSLLEVTLVLTADALRPGHSPPWAAPCDEEEADSITARVLAHECLHLRRLLATYRRRLRAHLARSRMSLDFPF